MCGPAEKERSNRAVAKAHPPTYLFPACACACTQVRYLTKVSKHLHLHLPLPDTEREVVIQSNPIQSTPWSHLPCLLFAACFLIETSDPCLPFHFPSSLLPTSYYYTATPTRDANCYPSFTLPASTAYSLPDCIAHLPPAPLCGPSIIFLAQLSGRASCFTGPRTPGPPGSLHFLPQPLEPLLLLSPSPSIDPCSANSVQFDLNLTLFADNLQSITAIPPIPVVIAAVNDHNGFAKTERCVARGDAGEDPAGASRG